MDRINSTGEKNSNRQKSENDENKNELKAINLQIQEIEKKIHQLRCERSALLNRQQELKQNKVQQVEVKRESTENWNRTDFPWSSKVEEVRQEIFRLNSFRVLQVETINVALSKRDCILIMPTGGGKSLCYQLPALISEGITIVVSPLLSLVDDQIYSLRKLKIDARSLNTSTSREEQNEIFKILDGKKIQNDSLKILFLTPEKIAKSKSIMSKLQKLYETNRFSRLVVDEVHCVSQFGHDFRPDYKYLSIFRRQFPDLPILGLTATATLKVIDDIRKILNIADCVLFRAPFNRKNLFYEVVQKSDVGKDAFADLVNCIKQRFDGQSGIIYCFSQKDAEDVCVHLQEKKIKAGCYHAGLSADARSEVHEKWIKNEILVICATIAFGMGIDKADVRFVIHHSLSKSIENFYQESGRAGRDDQQSHCILFFRFGDVFRLAPMAFSDKSGHGLKNLYSMISYCLNENQCRRKIISSYFNEVWQSNDCNQMCDICVRSSTLVSRRDCRDEALSILDYLEANSNQRLTALKLVEQVPIRSLTKFDLQRLLLQMLIDQYLKEKFRFTSYATICYIIPGPRANYLKNSNGQVLIDILETTKKRNLKTESSREKKETIQTSDVEEIKIESPETPVKKKTKRKRRVIESDEENQMKKEKSTSKKAKNRRELRSKQNDVEIEST